MKKKKWKTGNVAPYCYILPIALILLVFTVCAVVISVVLSFTKYNIITEPVFYGLRNYSRLFADSKFIKAFKNTFKLMLYIVPIQVTLSLLVAVFLTAHRKRILGKIANCVIFIPVLSSNAVVGVVWKKMLLGKMPVVEKIFGLFGLNPALLLGDAKAVLAVVAMVAIWKSVGYYVVIYSSGLLGISSTYYEAARVDGAGKVRCFWNITLPLLKPTIILTVFMSVTSSLQYYDLISNLTGGGPNNASTTLVVYAYSMCFGSSNAGYAMAISNILFLVILVAALLQSRFIRRDASEI